MKRRALVALIFLLLFSAAAIVVAWVALDPDVQRAGSVAQAIFAAAVVVVSVVLGLSAREQGDRQLAIERQARWDARIAATSLGDFKRPHLDQGSGYEEEDKQPRTLAWRVSNPFEFPILGLTVTVREGDPPAGRSALLMTVSCGNLPPGDQQDFAGYDVRAWTIEGKDRHSPAFASSWLLFTFTYTGGFGQRVEQDWRWQPVADDWHLERLSIDPHVEGMSPFETRL